MYKKTLGVIGMGRIGSEVIKRAQAMRMEVLAYDPYISESRAEKLGVTWQLSRRFCAGLILLPCTRR